MQSPGGHQSKQISYNCEQCGFRSFNKHNYNKHIRTIKHSQISAQSTCHSRNSCDKCGKTYCTRSGLWKHQRTCYIFPDDASSKDVSTESPPLTMEAASTLITQLVKENTDLKQMLIDDHIHTKTMMMEIVKSTTSANRS